MKLILNNEIYCYPHVVTTRSLFPFNPIFFTSPQMIEKTVFKSFKFLFSNMSIHLPLPLLHKLLRHLIENGKFLDD